MPNEQGSSKGFFGRVDLPVAKSYVYPANRNRLLVIGSVASGLIVEMLVINMQFFRSSLISNGPLSANHANFEGECASCHTASEAVSDEKCSVCHEKFADGLGVHTFGAHYVYMSADLTRAFGGEGELACAACHTEHGGRDAAITSVPDASCVGCHAFGSFNADHPEFEFAAASLPDDQNLTFTHIKHVERILDRAELTDVEQACLSCHIAEPEGRHFEPISFDTQCSTCHLGVGTESEELEVKNPRTPLWRQREEDVVLQLGVETLDTIQDRQGPGEQWALYTSRAEFDVDDGFVTKTRVIHRDPWIGHNLRLLRQVIYPSRGLADLLNASTDVQAHEKRLLYDEAVATLRGYADGLRGRSEAWIQEELEELDRAVGEVERTLSDQNTPLNNARFRLAERRNPALTSEDLDEINDFAETVAQPCQQCHRVENATIGRIQQDQQVLRRARFNHRAHIVQRGCLDCHTTIPFEDYLDVAGSVDVRLDGAAIQNLPTVAQCRQCHTPTLASNQCVTCHNFHPDTDNSSRLLLYLE